MLPNNGEEAIPSCSSSKNLNGISSKSADIISGVVKNIQKIDWNNFVKTIDWDISDQEDNKEDEEIEVADIPSTSNNNDNILLNANISTLKQNGGIATTTTTKKFEKIVDDGIQPCSSKTSIRIENNSSHNLSNNLPKINGILNNYSSNQYNKVTPLKVGLEDRCYLPPQLRQKHPFVAYKRFRDALSGTLNKKFKLGDHDPLQYELLNHEKHVSDLIVGKVFDKTKFEADRIQERDKISRRMIEERYEEERDKIVKQYDAAVTQLAEKMVSENEEERRQLEAELAAMGEGGEVPANFSYLPNRKQLRRRAGNPNDPLNEHSDKFDPYVPIHQVHWIDHRDISDDLDVVDYVLKNKDEPTSDRHNSIQIQEGKLILDGKTFNRGLNQVMIVKSQTFGEFPAIMLSLCENCLTVRSVIKGDPRHLTITRADLENGRVKISKKSTT